MMSEPGSRKRRVNNVITAAVGVVLAMGLIASSAQGADSIPASGWGAVDGAGFILWLVAYLRRKSPIGGWLLWFYGQSYVVACIGGIFLFNSTINSEFNSPHIADGAQRSLTALHFVGATIRYPIGVALVAQALFASGLLFASRRSERSLVHLRWVLGILGLLSAFGSIVTYIIGWSEWLQVFGTIAVWAAIWIEYFFLSKRVRLAFIEQAPWNYSSLSSGKLAGGKQES
jgi:hypothetical protein